MNDQAAPKDFVGVLNPNLKPSSIKQLLLVFDRLALPMPGDISQLVSPFSSDGKRESEEEIVRQIEWAIGEEVFFDPYRNTESWLQEWWAVLKTDSEFLHLVRRWNTRFEEHQEAISRLNKSGDWFIDHKEAIPSADRRTLKIEGFREGEDMQPLIRHFHLTVKQRESEAEFGNALALMTAYLLRRTLEADAVSVIPSVPGGSQAAKGEVLQVVIKNFPIPDEMTPFESIMAFRSDPSSKSKFLGLRRWMRKIARENLTPLEVQEEIDYLLQEYEQHMRLHEIKVCRGAVETIVVGAAELMEDLVKIKWGSLAKKLFSLTRRGTDLMEAEMSAPGREVAYIARARSVFSD